MQAMQAMTHPVKTESGMRSPAARGEGWMQATLLNPLQLCAAAEGPLMFEALGVSLPPLASDHPNRVPFRGVLTRLDEPSDRALHGARGHRVLLPTAIAEQALPTLIGMAVDIVPDLSDHDAQLKIGVITEASVQGRDLVIAGALYGKDFPDAVTMIQDGARHGLLGMSFEITNVAVADPTADVWTITQCTFTGAAILKKTAAAYGNTAIAASRENEEQLMKDLKEVVANLQRLQLDLAAVAKTEKPDVEDKGQEAATTKTTREPRQNREDEEAAREKTSADTEAMAAMSSPLARHIFGLGLRSLCKAMGVETVEEHEDEDDDMALLNRLGLSTGGRKTTAASATITASAFARVVKRLDDMHAAMELITDTISQQNMLLTDLVKQRQGLATDDAVRRETNGKEMSIRKTMAATTHVPQWVNKYPEISGKEKWSEGELSTLLKQHGVNEEQRIAIKLDLIEAGRLL